MDLISGCPFWTINSGLLAAYPRLHEPIDCDVVIIGGGITGAFTAQALQEAGLNTVVLDKRDIGFGSTSASTCLLQYEVDTHLTKLARIHGEDKAVRSYRACRDALAKIGRLAERVGGDNGFIWRESFYGASNPRDIPGLRREFELRRQHGFKASFWERAHIRDECSLPYGAAIISHEAAEIDAYRMTHALFRTAVASGLRIHDRTEVVSHRTTRRGVELRTAEGHRVRARHLVVASGYEAAQFLPKPVMELHSTYALVTEPLDKFPGWPGRRLIWETARPYVYLRTTQDGRAIIGGGDVPFRDPVERDKLLQAKVRWLLHRFEKLLPKIKPELAYSWTGTFATTDDGLPYIGRVKSQPHTWFALGYGGNGIIYSQIASEIIREGCLGRTHPDAELFGFARCGEL
ncbi:NAD(P)/FAD-dependent oxidoreductase [Oleiharenicola lentus]|uniref:NAD(P)/FAD-dependent oxidoreductase n=1 Tax=Oleiharenicola lentus TaxID=2508720 RepID=UPI003F67105B